jgi:peptidoglycan/LPS O-acetylase OafA/YrhL
MANLFLVHGLHPSGMQTGVPPSWSLAVEWVFYLLLPLMVMLALRLGGAARTIGRRRIAVLIPAGILLLIGLAGREAARRTVTAEDPNGVLNSWHAVIDKGFFTWADLFAIGMIIAVLRVDFEDGRLRRLPSWWRPAAIAGWLGLSTVLIWAQATGRLEWHHYNALMGVAIGLFFCAVVLWQGEPRRDPLMRILTLRPLVALGNMSLSIYLLHYPVIVFLIQRDVYQSGYAGMAFNWALTAAVVLPLAYLSYRFIELPFMRRKVRTKAEGPPPVEDALPAGALTPEPSRAPA